MNDNLIHLHVHTEYSNERLLDSTIKIEALLLYVASVLGQKGIAITDHECVGVHVEVLQTAERLKSEGKIPHDFKVILGNEIYLTDSSIEERMDNNQPVKFYHFLLLAKDLKGHEQLRKLSSCAWRRMRVFRGMERVPTYYSDFEEIVGDNKGHLIGSTACLGSRFANLVTQLIALQKCREQGIIMSSQLGIGHAFGEDKEIRLDNEEFEKLIDTKKDEIHEFLMWGIDTFGQDDFYIELQPSLANEDKTPTEQEEYNELALHIARAYGIKPIVTTDAHYLTVEDRPVHEAFLTSDEDGSGSREVASFYGTTHLFTSEELHANLHYIDNEVVKEMIANTNDIAHKVEQYSLAHNQVIPKIPINDNIEEWFTKDKVYRLQSVNKLYELSDKYENIKKMIDSDNIYDRYLVAQCFKGIIDRVPICDVEEYLERMDIECWAIRGVSDAKQEPISAYFITMQKIIDIIWDTGSFVGTGRGSAGCFLINYLLQIVQINPLRQGVKLEYWRFLHPSKVEIPDIDIDVSSHKRDIVFKALHEYFTSIGGDVVRVCTVGTETAKSAIQTACRGLGINNDIATYISSLVPSERGIDWNLKTCYYGDEDEGVKPVTEMVNQFDQHPRLLEVALGVEGLVSRRGVHACGILVVNGDITKYNALMRAPNGELTTQYTLYPSEYAGLIKYDLLNTKTCGMLQITFEMLIEHGHMEWQGSLRETYDKYLHPDVIDSTTHEMWERLCNHELISAFQMDGDVGENAVRMIQPHSVIETSQANTVMRLMCDGEEQPLQKYARYKHDINEWYNDMRNYGLTEDEIKVLEPLLLHDSGVCGTQESMMAIVMDENVAGFDVPQANFIRKIVAKKKMRDIPKVQQLYYSKGHECGARQIFLDYIWEEQISLQLGYSFCLAHSLEYTWILVQQLNLIHHYPSIYWNTAVLLVESGAIAQDTNGEEDSNKKEKTTNYGVVASAISTLQNKGVDIALPNINIASVGFIPSEETNSIMFGLKGVSTINNDVAQIIIDNRPYTSLMDFHDRLVVAKREITLSTGKKQMKSYISESQAINLIKAGAFDTIEEKPREQILEDYLIMLNPPKKALTTANINQVIEFGIVPSEYDEYVKHHNFKQYLGSLDKKQDENSKSIKWIVVECFGDDEMTEYTTNYLFTHFSEMVEGRDYDYDENGNVIVAVGTKRKGSFEHLYSEKMKPFSQWLNSKECVDIYNHIVFSDIKRDKMSGNVARWEMESMNYYYTKHELSDVDKNLYSVVNFNDLEEEPKVVGFSYHKGIEYPKFELHRLCGTVLDRDKNKHIVTLLTEYGVVTVKFYSGQFSFYDKTLSVEREDGSGKTKVEDSWFKRGNRLIVTGFRRGNQFRPKRYQNSIYQHSLSLIKEVHIDGTLTLQHERTYID